MRLEQDRTDLQQIVFYLLVFGLGLVILIQVLEIGYHLMQRHQFEQKVMAVAPTELHDLQAAQEALLEQGVRWTDPQNGRIGMPIEEAMKVVVSEHGEDGR